MPSIVIGELLAGFLAGDQMSRNEYELDEFLDNVAVDTVPVDDEVARIYAEIAVSLKIGGRPLPTNDVWIAATSARAGAPLLTFDDHFEQIDRIGTILLQAGP